MVRVLWATAAVLAIFAMHGLATHGTAHPSRVTPVASAVAAVEVDAHATHGGTAPGSPATAAAPGEHHHEMSVLGLCLAVLATAAVALLRLVRPRSGLLAVLPRPVSVVPRPSAPVHGHGPPDLYALSVLRC